MCMKYIKCNHAEVVLTLQREAAHSTPDTYILTKACVTRERCTEDGERSTTTKWNVSVTNARTAVILQQSSASGAVAAVLAVQKRQRPDQPVVQLARHLCANWRHFKSSNTSCQGWHAHALDAVH